MKFSDRKDELGAFLGAFRKSNLEMAFLINMIKGSFESSPGHQEPVFGSPFGDAGLAFEGILSTIDGGYHFCLPGPKNDADYFAAGVMKQ